jgi:hypothetical protein
MQEGQSIDDDLIDSEDEEEGYEGEEDGSFDDEDNIFDANAKKPEESIFTDKPSIFSTPHSPDVNQNNPLTTNKAEIARYEAPLQLVAKFDAQSKPHVALHDKGKAIEAWRKPTEKEFQALKVGGKIVKGGLGDVTPLQPLPGTGSFLESLPWKKIAIGAVVVGGAAGAYWYIKKRKKSRR